MSSVYHPDNGRVWRKFPTVAYYSLASLDLEVADSASLTPVDAALGIGPVSVPEYLKKSQIATRLGDSHRYQFDEFHRWAGIIENDIAAVLGNNLGLLLGTHKIAFFPWMHYFAPDYRVAVEIIQFDSDLDGDAVLSARWTIRDGSGENLLVSEKSDYQQTLSAPSYDALVTAENQLLEHLSRDIAKKVRELPVQK